MVASDVVSTSTSTFVTVVTVSFSTPTGSSLETLPNSLSSNDNNHLLVGLASAGGFALFLFVIGLLFCLKYTRTKHRRRIEDMEHRLNGLENRSKARPEAQTKRFSTATGTSLGSSWGAWRSKDVKNFQKLRTASQTTGSDNRKSFAHGWWSISPATRNQDHGQNVTPLQDITSFRTANPPQTNDTSENDMEPLMTPRLSAIVECPSPSPSQVPACPDPPVVKALHHDPAGTQTHPYSLCDDKEIDVTSEIVKVPNQKNDISSIDKEVAITNGTGFQKNTAEKRPAAPSIPTKTHQRKPALAGAISVFPPGDLTGADTLHPTSSRYRPFSAINGDPSIAPAKPVPPPPPMRKPNANRRSRSYSHIRNHSVFSNDSRSSVENLVAGRMSAQSNHARSSSAQSNTVWPWDIHSPKVDYGSASDSLPRFKQHRSPNVVAEESKNRLQNLTTSELDVSTAARIESTDPRAADIADSYRTLVEKEGRSDPMAKDILSRKSENMNLSYKLTRGSKGKRRSSSAPPSNSSYAIIAPASPISSHASSSRSSEGNPFHFGEPSDRSNSSHTTSTSYLKRSIPRSRSVTDPGLNVAKPATNSSTISTRRGAGKTGERKSRAANRSSTDLNIVIPTPTLHYHASTFGTPKMQPLPRCQYARKVEPILEQDEPMRSAEPNCKPLDWNRTPNAHVVIKPSHSLELVSPSNVPPRAGSAGNRKSRDKDEKTYNVLNGSPSSCQPSLRKKCSLVGASETFFMAKDRSPTGVVISCRRNSDSRRTTKNGLTGSREEFSSYADCSRTATPSVKSPREDNNCTNSRVRELKKTRRSGLRSILSPYPISEDEAVDQTSPTAYSPFSPTSASPGHPSSYNLRRHLSLKSLGSPVIPSPCLSDTTPSEIDARETNKMLLQSFPAPTLPPATGSSSQNPFASPDCSSSASVASTRDTSPITATPSIRQGFGPGPSPSLLEKWEKQGRSYITSHAAIVEEEDGGIQTFARGKAPRNLSPALGGGEHKTSGGESNVYPPIESTRKKTKHTRWESRGEIAEIISPQNSSLHKPTKPANPFPKPQVLPASHQREVSKASTTTTNTSDTPITSTTSTWTALPKPSLKALLKPSESARRAEAVGMKKSIDSTNISDPGIGSHDRGGGSHGNNTSKKVSPRGSSPPRKRGPKVEELGKILGGKGVGW